MLSELDTPWGLRFKSCLGFWYHCWNALLEQVFSGGRFPRCWKLLGTGGCCFVEIGWDTLQQMAWSGEQGRTVCCCWLCYLTWGIL